MIKPTRDSVANRPISNTPSFQLPSTPLSLVGFDHDGNIEIQLSAAVEVPAAIGGAKVVCTIAFYDDINRNSVNPPVYFTRVDFSAFIDNDSLKKSTLLYGTISNQQSSLIRPVNSQLTLPGFVPMVINSGYVTRSGTAFKSDYNAATGTSRTRPIDRFIEMGRPPFLESFIPRDIATRSPRHDGVLMGRSNPANSNSLFSLRPIKNLSSDEIVDSRQRETVQLQRDYRLARCRAVVKIPAEVLSTNKKLLIVPGSPDMNELSRPGRIESIFSTNIEPGGSNLRAAVGLKQPTATILGIDSDSSTIKVQVGNPNNKSVSVKIARFGVAISDHRVQHQNLTGLQLGPGVSDVISINIEDLKALFLGFTCVSGPSVSFSTLMAVPQLDRKYHNTQISNKSLKNASARVLARNNSQTRSIEVLVLIDAPRQAEDITVKRRLRSISGAILGEFEDVASTIIRTPGTVRVSDTALRHDYFYEYAAFSLLERRQIGMSSFVLFRDPIFFASEVGVMSVQFATTDTTSGDAFDVGVKFSALRVEDTLTALLNSTDGSIPTSNGNVQIGNYVENIKNNREKLADLYRISIVRQDLDTGREYDLGTFPSGRIEITDQLLASRSVPPRSAQSNYVFRLLQRNAITLFNEIEEVIKDPDTLVDFRVRVSKFLGPLNLVSSILPSSLRLREKNPLRASKFFPSDDFLEGFTGVTRTLSVGSNDNTNASGTVSFTFRTDSFGERIFVSPRVEHGPGTIGFILSCVFGDTSIPLGFFPAGHMAQLELEDDVTGKLVGPRRYTVSFVSDQLEIGTAIESEKVNGRGYNG